MQAKRREIFWCKTPEDLALHPRWRMIAKRASAAAGEPVHVDAVVAMAGQLWSIAAQHDGAINVFDPEILAAAIDISDNAAAAIGRAFVDKAVFDGPRLSDWDRVDRIGWCKTPEDLALHPRWRMIAEITGVRTGVVIALMHYLWKVAGCNRGAVAEFDAKFFSNLFRVTAEQVQQLRQALVDEGIIKDEVLVDWERLVGGLSPGARRKRRYDRNKKRRHTERPEGSDTRLAEPPSLGDSAERHRRVAMPLPSVTGPSPVTPPPAPPPEDSQQISPLKPPLGGPALGGAVFRCEKLEILPPCEKSDTRRVVLSATSCGAGVHNGLPRYDTSTGDQRRSGSNQRSGRATASRDGPVGGGVSSRRAAPSASTRRARPGLAEIDAYQPSRETLAWADENAPEIDAGDPENVQAFVDECRFKARRFRDLDAGYRKWLRQERDRARRGSYRRLKRGDLLNSALADMQGGWAT